MKPCRILVEPLLQEVFPRDAPCCRQTQFPALFFILSIAVFTISVKLMRGVHTRYRRTQEARATDAYAEEAVRAYGSYLDPECLSVFELRRELDQRGLSHAGTRAVLIKRIRDDDANSLQHETMRAPKLAKAEQVKEHAQDILLDIIGEPVAATHPPRYSVFHNAWRSATLLERSLMTPDTLLLTFMLPNIGKDANAVWTDENISVNKLLPTNSDGEALPAELREDRDRDWSDADVWKGAFGLSTCACLLCRFFENGDEEPIVRSYTPISMNMMLGKFVLLVKVYTLGKMSQHMKALPLGASLEFKLLEQTTRYQTLFKHMEKNMMIHSPFGNKHVTMLVGGSGITAMIQVLHVILGSAGDMTQVSLIYGNKARRDILCKDVLSKWSNNSCGRFKVLHVLSQGHSDYEWGGQVGFIDEEVIAENSAPPSEDVLVMICGPRAMYDALCGPRENPQVGGILAKMGYDSSQVCKC